MRGKAAYNSCMQSMPYETFQLILSYTCYNTYRPTSPLPPDPSTVGCLVESANNKKIIVSYIIKQVDFTSAQQVFGPILELIRPGQSLNSNCTK